MSLQLDQRCRDLIADLGIAPADAICDVSALSGGVASDIASLRVADQMYCVKFALPKLKVAADWFAPVHRNAAEYAWLSVAADVVPNSAIRLFGRSEDAHGFVMEFISGHETYLWKAAMLQGQPPRDESRSVGDMLGRIHAASTKEGFDTAPFHNRDDFRALRIEPYLTYTASVHAEVANELNALAYMLYDGDAVLVHGDVSPKNILIREAGPVILDAECASMGDASFDPSFCLNHLVLKSIHLPGIRDELLAAIAEFWNAYAAHIAWEDPADLEARVCRLLPALMLARIDGKSPVEYLDETRRAQVRQLALPLIRQPTQTLDALVKVLRANLKEQDA